LNLFLENGVCKMAINKCEVCDNTFDFEVGDGIEHHQLMFCNEECCIAWEKQEKLNSFQQHDQCTNMATYTDLWNRITSDRIPGRSYKFDITQIDGVGVWVEVENILPYISPDKVEHFRMAFIIHSSSDNRYLYHQLVSSIEELEQTLTRTYEFNKYHGLFEDREKPIPNFDHLFKGSVMISNAQGCCCCHDLTKSKTNCGHYICYQCRQKLTTKKCPMCRKKLVIDGECDSDDE